MPGPTILKNNALTLVCVFLLAGQTAKADDPTPEQLDFFEKSIRPVLVENCYKCHSVEGKGMVVGAWDTDGQVYFTRIDQGTAKLSQPVAAPGKANKRKHPALAVNASGETLLVWTEGMGWNKGGSLAWCVYDKNGQPTKEQGQVNGVPVWSLVTAVALPDGSFRIFY